MMAEFRFGTAINCIDGRTHEVVIEYMKQKYKIDGVDMVTFPGADGIFSQVDSQEIIAIIKNAVSISTKKHGSRIIAVIGHHDCAGNPGDREHHHSHIRKAVNEVSAWDSRVNAVGLYVNEKREIEELNPQR